MIDTEQPTFEGAITGNEHVNSRASDDSDEPRPKIVALSPGDEIKLDGETYRVRSVGKRVNFGQRGVYRLHIHVGAPASLYVDRDPYMLDMCNAPVREVDPEEVTV